MTDKPLICAPSVARAIWAGRQTQDRRPIKLPPKRASLFDGTWSDSYVLDPGNASWRDRDLPYHVGDRLWVRESFAVAEHPLSSGRGGVRYWADGGWSDAEPTPEWRKQFNYRGGQMSDDGYGPTVPSIHMPRRLSRQTLLVESVSIQRLQDISDEDAQAEGLAPCDACGGYHGGGEHADISFPTARYAFSDLWNTLYGSRPGLSWDDNPWVCATTFQAIRRNIDQMEG